jgi:elongation factor G
MGKYKTSDIRNVALVGHGASGKTTLTEACLFKAKAIPRRGTVADGSTVSDFDVEEKEAKHSIDTAITHFTWKGREVNWLDTPGYPDFVGEAISAMSSVDAVIVAVDASAGVKVNTRKVWQLAADRGRPRAIVITRADAEHAKWDERLADIRANFGEKCIPLVVPKGGAVGLGFKGVESAFPLGQGASGPAQEAYKAALETAVERDEALMTRYLEGEELGEAEVKKALREAFRAGAFFPIFLTAAEKDLGLEELLNAVVDLFPDPTERTYAALDADSGAPVEVSVERPFTAQVFKTLYDPFIGKIAYLRIYSGSLPQNAMVLAPHAKGSLKIAHLYRVQGKDQQEVTEAVAGDIVAVNKLEELHVSDTLTTGDFRVKYPALEFPVPMVSVAVEPKSRQDEGKISQALTKLLEADPTIQQHRDPQTHELVVNGMSNLQLETLLHRLKRRYQVEVTTKVPKVPYLETITTKGDAKYRHKKQTGGAGQFAEVWMRIEPQPRGKGFEFESEVVGGAISSSFIPSIEKGVRHVLERGVVAGFPVVDVKAIVYDGKEHPVDSKDIAFQVAGRGAFREAMKQAKPVLLEPIVDAEIAVPSDYLGAVMGDLNGRRGRITSTDTAGSYSIVKAKVPLAEMLTYSSELRSMTGGEGSYTLAPSHYDPVPSQIAQQVIAQYKKEEKEEE